MTVDTLQAEVCIENNNTLIPYKALPKQKEFHKDKSRFRLYSGGFGSGKTLSGCIEGFKQSMKYPGNQGAIIRKTYPELRMTTRKAFFEDIKIKIHDQVFNLIDSPLIKKWHKSEGVLQFRNGSEILFVNMDSPEKIKSAKLGWAYVDEMTEVTQDDFNMLRGRLRHPNIPESGRKLWGTTNPENPYHWVYNQFFTNKGDKYFHVDATSLENTYLPSDYIADLEDYDADYYDRFVLGKWTVFEGLIYKEFKESMIIKKWTNEVDEVVAGMDFGYVNPTAINLYTEPYSNTVVQLDEYYEKGTTIDDWIKQLKEWRSMYGLKTVYCDPSEPAYIKQIADAGFIVNPSNNKVNSGIVMCKEVLNNWKFWILEHCVNTIKEFRLYKRKKQKGEVVSESVLKINDHSMDAFRYYVATHLFDQIAGKVEKFF